MSMRKYIVTTKGPAELDFETKKKVATAIAIAEAEEKNCKLVAWWDNRYGGHHPILLDRDVVDFLSWCDDEERAFSSYVRKNAEICIEVDGVEFYFFPHKEEVRA